MKFIDASTVHRALEYSALIAGLKQLHLDDTHKIEDLLLEQPVREHHSNHLLIRAAWQYDQAIGMKMVTVFPGNNTRRKSLPAIQAVYVLFDGVNGEPLAAVDGVALTCRKTAADSALGASYLAPRDAKHLLMVGAGTMAPHLIAAHKAARPTINRVTIWNRTPEKARHLAETLELDGLSVECAAELEQAVRSADIVSCATMSRQPLIYGDWLSPHTHLDLVGAFTADMREADDACFGNCTVFVDSRQTTVLDVGEIMIPIANGVMTAEDIVADLYDLCRNKHPGRRNADEITLFKNGGGGHLDLMTTRFLLDRIKGVSVE